MTDPAPPATAPSPRLLSFALAGLLGVSACGDDAPAQERGSRPAAGGASSAAPDAGGAGSSSAAGGATGGDPSSSPTEPYVFVISSGPPVTYAEMAETCGERGGYLQTHAACGGSNLCRGISYVGDDLRGTLTEHSCRAMNACRGISCIDAPDDTGLSGKELFLDGPCGGCHDGSEEGAPDPVYTVFVSESLTDEQGAARFEESSAARLETIVAFGVQGVNQDGSSFSNMPAYREQYSRAEIARVVEYLRTLRYELYRYTTQGVDGGGAAGGPHAGLPTDAGSGGDGG